MKEETEPELIVVKVSPDGDNYLKIVWQIEGMSYLYLVHISPLLEPAGVLRKRLKELVDCETIRGGASKESILFNLAKAGHDLYSGLFAATSGGLAARKVKELISAPASRYIIMFKVEDDIHIPWGLMYDSDPEEMPDGEATPPELNNYPHFWCLKYDAAAINKKITWPSTQAIPENHFRILSVVNRPALLKAAKSLPQKERAELWNTARWLARDFEFKEPVFERSKLFSLWGSDGDKVNFLCFYGHADEKTLSLGKGQDLPMNDFLTKLSRADATPERPGCVVFLNGCMTAVGRNGQGFLQVAGREGFCGFIGTETKIPDLFALRFGVEFVKLFLDKNRKVYEIMRSLREKYWPLSLTYSTCCYPLKYIEDSRAAGAGETGGAAALPPATSPADGPSLNP